MWYTMAVVYSLYTMEEPSKMTHQGIHRHPWHWVALGLVILIAILFFIVSFLRSYARIVQAQRDGVSTGLVTKATDATGKPAETFGPQRQVSDGDHAALGPEDAKVTIVEFGDFECPYCGRSYPIVRWIKEHYGDRVRLVYRHFPIATIHANAAFAAEASECAREQGKFWEYHDALYEHQDALSKNDLVTYAGLVKLDVEKFQTCVASGRMQSRVRADAQAALQAGASGTPTFFINGHRWEGFVSQQQWEQILENLLNV